MPSMPKQPRGLHIYVPEDAADDFQPDAALQQMLALGVTATSSTT
jgi:hypothetical protein